MDSIPAIYEDGVFKPLGPVSLPERAEVEVTVPATGCTEPTPPEEGDQATGTERQSALRNMFERVDALAQHENNDEWAARNHDDILYGRPEGPA